MMKIDFLKILPIISIWNLEFKFSNGKEWNTLFLYKAISYQKNVVLDTDAFYRQKTSLTLKHEE